MSHTRPVGARVRDFDCRFKLCRFRRLAWDDARLPETLTGLHFLAFAIVLFARPATLKAQESACKTLKASAPVPFRAREPSP